MQTSVTYAPQQHLYFRTSKASKMSALDFTFLVGDANERHWFSAKRRSITKVAEVERLG